MPSASLLESVIILPWPLVSHLHLRNLIDAGRVHLSWHYMKLPQATTAHMSNGKRKGCRVEERRRDEFCWEFVDPAELARPRDRKLPTHEHLHRSTSTAVHLGENLCISTSMLRSSSAESAEGLLARKDDAGPSHYDSQGQVADCLGQARRAA